MRTLALFVGLVLSLEVAHAQKKQNVYFLKDNGDRVKSRDSADVVRIIEEPDSGTRDFILKEFYANRQPKTLGKVSAFDPQLIYEGLLLRYDKEGKKKSEVTYAGNKPRGEARDFYPDGTVSRIVNYDVGEGRQDPDANRRAIEGDPFRMIYLTDSLKNVLVRDGNGTYKMPLEIFGQVLQEEGAYVDGYKQGEWKASNPAGDIWYSEKFDRGNFISGESSRDGIRYRYTREIETPDYKGGIEKFYRYLGSNIEYPRTSYKAKITGTVYLSFVIEKDGSVNDIKVTRGVNDAIDLEAVRVLSRSPNWIPGKQHGIAVRVKYNIPIKFALSR